MTLFSVAIFHLIVGNKLFAEQSGAACTNTFQYLFNSHKKTFILSPTHLHLFPLILLGQK